MPRAPKPNPKADIVQRVVAATMHLIHDSDLQNTPLWPKNGFKVGSFPEKNKLGNYKADTICAKVLMQMESSYYWIRFNLWCTTYGRGLKQQQQLILIFDQAVSENLYFFIENLDYYENKMSAHFNDYGIMGMLDVRFTIQ